MLNEAGSEARDVYNSFLPKLKNMKVLKPDGTYELDKEGQSKVQDNSENYDIVVREFNHYAQEHKSVSGNRRHFYKRNQKNNEPFLSWLIDLRNLIRHCEYGSIEDSMLLDRIIDGTADPRLRETLQAKNNLTLSCAIEQCKAAESRRDQSIEGLPGRQCAILQR